MFFDKIDIGKLKIKSILIRQSQYIRVTEGIFEDIRIIKKDDTDKVEREEDYDAFLNRLDKEDVQRQVARYLRQDNKILNNVCVRVFP